MAEIRKRVRGGKISWLARHYDPDGRRVSKTFSRQEDARRWLVKAEGSKLSGDYIDPARAKLLTGDMADLWLATQGHLKPSTLARYRGIVDGHIRPRFGRTPLSKLGHADIAAWLSGLTLAPASIRYIHRVLFLLLELAVRDGRLSKNPAAGVRLPKATKVEKRFLTRDEVSRLAAAAAQYPTPEFGAQYRALVLMLAFCGLRWGEAAGPQGRPARPPETPADGRGDALRGWRSPGVGNAQESPGAIGADTRLSDRTPGRGDRGQGWQ
jgi:integrase